MTTPSKRKMQRNWRNTRCETTNCLYPFQSIVGDWINSRALEKNISRDLHKKRYGYVQKVEYDRSYVSISINAFITLIDMCHDNLSRFETFVYRVVVL